MTRRAIVFTANTVHVAQANLMIESLFDQARGNFDGDLWVISTHLSMRCQQFLESRGIRYLINPLISLGDWKYRREIARAQPEYVNGVLDEDAAFELYRNKRMSKLIICDWADKFGDAYDQMALCDNDLYFQRDVNELFDKCQADTSAVWYWQEENENLPGTNLWVKNFHYARFHDTSDMDFGKHEINIGFVVSTPQLISRVFAQVRDLFSSCAIELFRDHKWHDQDLVRVIRAKSPELFRLFDEGDVLHLCNGGKDLLEETESQSFFHKKTEQKPYVVHFAGGMWKPFASIAQSYKVDADAYFFMEENSVRFDALRQNSEFDPFEKVSVFFSEHNHRTRNEARAHWMKRREGSVKKSMLFFSWLDTGSHVPQRSKLSDFLGDETFDLAIIDGNVKHREHDGLVFEDLPDLLANVTMTVRDKNFVQAFGFRRDDIPEEAITGAIAALQKEYRCTERAARAVANAAYLYLARTIAFYRPDIVVGWGTYLLVPRILRHICADFGVPMMTMELGVLPDTMAFDCLGHMGESWVTRHADKFNALPLSDKDRTTAQTYLERVRAERPSRNLPIDVSDSTRCQLQQLGASKKKIVLFVGSNDAFSGNVPYGDAARKFHSPLYKDNDEIVSHLSEIFANNPDVQIVYKPHPITITRGLDLAEAYADIVTVSDCNLGDCLEIADLVIANVSQGSYEALFHDKPVLMLGMNQINGSGAVYQLGDRDGLENAVQDALAGGYTDEQRARFNDHVARALKYYLYNVSGSTGARPQDRVAPDMLSLLNGKAAEHLADETTALAAYRKPQRFKAGKTPRLSIVMPVFNGEEHLADCIGSILNQTMSDFELLCVNNGSSDGSQDILEYFAARDSRVKVIWQDEPNQRAARNLGVENARGTYLQFFDCDDLLHPDAYRQILDAIEESKADVLYYFYSEMYSRPTIGAPRYFRFRNFFPQDRLFRMREQDKPLFALYPFPWAKVFRRDVLVEKGLLFDLDCANFDDNPQNLRTLLSTDDVFVLNKSFYRFRIHSKSMTQSTNPRVYGMIDAIRLMNEICEASGKYAQFQPYLVPYKIHLLNFAWDRLPDQMKEGFLDAIPDLIRPGDERYFNDGPATSLFLNLNIGSIDFVRNAAAGDKRVARDLKDRAANKPPIASEQASLPELREARAQLLTAASRFAALPVNQRARREAEALADDGLQLFALARLLRKSGGIRGAKLSRLDKAVLSILYAMQSGYYRVSGKRSKLRAAARKSISPGPTPN